MKRLKNILQHKILYIVLIIFCLIYVLLNVYLFSNNSKYNEKETSIYGYINDFYIDDNVLTIELIGKEKILCKYKIKDTFNKSISYGDYIKLNGTMNVPKNNTVFNLFNYKKYLKSKKINYIFNAKDIIIINKNKNIFFKIKSVLVKRINNNNTSSYIKTFILGDKRDIDNDQYKKYQNLGISHLFAVSGMHVSFLAMFLLKILKKISDKEKYIIIILFMIFYMFLTNYSVSICRAVFQFILFSINKIFNLKLSNVKIIIFTICLLLFINPFNIYSSSFLFSIVISSSIMILSENDDESNYLKSAIKISTISFLSSMPLVINNYFQINILSIFYNIIFIPFVSYILFPINILTMIFPILNYINDVIIYYFEILTSLLNNITILTFSVSKINIIFLTIYYILFFLCFKKNNKMLKYIFIIYIFFILFRPIYSYSVTMFDVGQGDSLLVRLKNKNVLIDTGGKYNTNISNTIHIPYMKSVGIKKIDYLVLTHGDYDHMEEAINLVNSFKVEKVIFNCGPYNDLEKELIKVLDKKKIKYYSCIRELNIDNNKLHFLQTKEYDNENDNSNVIYTELNGYKFMFMGDAGIEKEKDILEKYNISNIDVLKVGHHGSKTSSDKNFINEIDPKYSIISVGKNNRYGHPNKEVLNNLNNSKIYRTDQDGSIMFKIKNNKLKIKTCSP